MASTERAREGMGLPATGQVSRKDIVIAERSHQLEAMLPQFQRAMPSGLEAKQITRDVITALRQNEDLWKCTPESLFGGAMTAAQLALRVGVLGHCWLIPFENRRKNVHEAQFVMGYQGMIELAQRTGNIVGISGHAIYSNEKYQILYGSEERIIHEPLLVNRGTPIAYYTQVWYANGGYGFKAIGHDEILEIREGIGSAKRRDSPWQTQLRAMALKTCMRRMFTFMPKTSALALGIESDSVTRTDLAPEALVQVQPDGEPAEPGSGAAQPGDTARETITVTDPAPAPENAAQSDPEPAEPRTRIKQRDSQARKARLTALANKYGTNPDGLTEALRSVFGDSVPEQDTWTIDELQAALLYRPAKTEPEQGPVSDDPDGDAVAAAFEADQQTLGGES